MRTPCISAPPRRLPPRPGTQPPRPSRPCSAVSSESSCSAHVAARQPRSRRAEAGVHGAGLIARSTLDHHGSGCGIESSARAGGQLSELLSYRLSFRDETMLGTSARGASHHPLRSIRAGPPVRRAFEAGRSRSTAGQASAHPGALARATWRSGHPRRAAPGPLARGHLRGLRRRAQHGGQQAESCSRRLGREAALRRNGRAARLSAHRIRRSGRGRTRPPGTRARLRRGRAGAFGRSRPRRGVAVFARS